MSQGSGSEEFLFQPIPQGEEFDPLVHARRSTLGYMAVETAYADLQGEENPFWFIPSMRDIYLRGYVAEARTGLESVRDHPKLYLLGRSFPASEIPAPIVRGLGFQKAPSREALLARLTAKDSGGTPAVTDGPLLEFLRHYQTVLQRGQVVYQRKGRPELISTFQRGFNQGVRSGAIPRSAMPNLGRFVSTEIILDDGFNTSGRGTAAYITRRDNEHYGAVFGPTSDKETRIHELSHVIAGEDKAITEDDITNPTRAGMYRLFGLKKRTDGMTVLDEGVTDHLAEVILGGSVEVISAVARVARNKPYDGTMMLNALSRYGKRPIDPRLFIAAQLENEDQRTAAGVNSALETLGQQMVDAFPGIDILRTIVDLKVDDPRAIFDFAKRLRSQYPVRNAVRRAKRIIAP